jgi:hypothetical protein
MHGVNSPFAVCAYWGDRQESAAMVSGRLGAFLAALAAVHPSLGAWWNADDGQRVPAGAPELLPLVEASRFEPPGSGALRPGGGFGVDVISDEGVALRIASGRSEDSPAILLSISCSRDSGFPVPNSCLLELPAPDEAPAGLYDPETVSAVVTMVVRAWQPDHVIAASDELREAQSEEIVVDVGWITYLGSRYAGGLDRRSLPAGIEAAELNSGTLLRFPCPAASVTPDMVVGLRRRLVGLGALPELPSTD